VPPQKSRKKTTEQKLAEQENKAQADEIARILTETCSLLDDLLVRSKPALPESPTEPVVDRMQAYLDRRGVKAEDPPWVAKMRRTVTGYRVQRARLRGDDAFNID